jgi:hypothetical protein
MIRSILSRLAVRVVRRIVRDINPRVILDGEGKRPYLSRYYLIGAPTMPDGSSPFDRFGNARPEARAPEGLRGLYIHCFHRSDDDRELHNHPWEWALSFVVAGGYREERRLGNRVVSRDVLPLSLNFIRAEDYHRVDLLKDEAWSIFLTGPKMASWGFWDRTTGEVAHWREFLAKKQRGELE